MTDRIDVEELVERLQARTIRTISVDDGPDGRGGYYSHNGPDPLCTQAATAISALEKERDEARKWNNHACERIGVLQDRAQAAETELSALKALAGELVTLVAHGSAERPVGTDEWLARATFLAEAAERRMALGRPDGTLRCYDCGVPYAESCDLVIPDAAWAKIAPRPDGGGVLCPTCIHRRLVAAGFEDGTVPAKFTSGPMACEVDAHD